MMKGLRFFRIQLLFDYIKETLQQRLKEKILKDPELGEDMEQDNNQIELLLFISYGFQTAKLFIIVFNLSFFIGMFWLIFCSFTKNVFENEPLYQQKFFKN